MRLREIQYVMESGWELNLLGDALGLTPPSAGELWKRHTTQTLQNWSQGLGIWRACINHYGYVTENEPADTQNQSDNHIWFVSSTAGLKAEKCNDSSLSFLFHFNIYWELNGNPQQVSPPADKVYPLMCEITRPVLCCSVGLQHTLFIIELQLNT